MIVQVSAKILSCPDVCPCCGEAADVDVEVTASRTTGVRVLRTTTRSWRPQFCLRCVAHIDAWRAAMRSHLWIPFLILALFLAVAWVPFAIIVAIIGIVTGVSRRASLKRRARAMCSPSCVSPAMSVTYLGWSGSVHSFDFVSSRYAGLFAKQNAGKLVNVMSDLRKAIAATEAAEPILVADCDIVRDSLDEHSSGDMLLAAIAKIESQRGPAARRIALDMALHAIADENTRNRLVLEASRIEVRAVLDRVDALKSPAAKRRRLQETIDMLKADSIPDALQVNELRLLETALSNTQ